MGAISLRIPDDVLETSGQCAKRLHLSRSAYIRRAVERQNRETIARVRAARLAEVSHRVRAESMLVNEEFSRIEGDPEA